MYSYSKLKDTGACQQSAGSMFNQTVLIPQYGASAYSTLQASTDGSSHRTFATAYGKEGECGSYYSRAIMN